MLDTFTLTAIAIPFTVVIGDQKNGLATWMKVWRFSKYPDGFRVWPVRGSEVKAPVVFLEDEAVFIPKIYQCECILPVRPDFVAYHGVGKYNPYETKG